MTYLQDIARSFARSQGNEPYTGPLAPLPPWLGWSVPVARAYDRAPIIDTFAATGYAYRTLCLETRAQYQTLARYVKFRWYGAGCDRDTSPYARPAEMFADLASGNLAVFRGGNVHPVLSTPLAEYGGLTDNDIFRAVHDCIGHGASGAGFGPRGEETAYRVQRPTYSALAGMALATETRGQQAWFAVHGDYAVQKATILPAWTRATDIIGSM